MGPTALSVICKLFCLDYAARASGGPDLVLWNYEQRKCKFVEVKGPGDTARENQVVWVQDLMYGISMLTMTVAKTAVV